MLKLSQSLSVLTVFCLLLLCGCIASEKANGAIKIERNVMIFKGSLLHFRADLKEASKIKVIPEEGVLAEMLLNEKLKRVVIAIPNVSSNAGYYGVAAYELAYKLTFIYNSIYAPFTSPIVYEENNFTCLYYADFNKNICIGKEIYDSYEELKGNESLVVIALLGEGLANETLLVAKQEKGVIFVKGKSFSMENGYTELDLAVDKLLLVLFRNLSNA